MGVWESEAIVQRKQFNLERMNTRNALELIAYWAQECGEKTSAKRWIPLVLKIIRDAEPVTFTKFQQMVRSEPTLPIPHFSKFIRENITFKIFDIEPKEPAVTPDIKAEVFDFIDESARILDRDKPNVRVPRFRKKDFTDKGESLLFKTFIHAVEVAKKKPKRKFNIGVLLLIAAIVASERG